jgi:hypothetical protein
MRRGKRIKDRIVYLFFCRFVSGYTSARVYTRLGGGRKRRNALFTAVGLNGAVFLIYFIADIILWSNDSSAGRKSNFFIPIGLFHYYFSVSLFGYILVGLHLNLAQSITYLKQKLILPKTAFHLLICAVVRVACVICRFIN